MHTFDKMSFLRAHMTLNRMLRTAIKVMETILALQHKIKF